MPTAGSGESTNKVQSIVEDAERLREEAAVEHSGGAFEGAVASGAGDGGDDSEAADDGATETPDSDDAGEDDQQSGLSDFM